MTINSRLAELLAYCAAFKLGLAKGPYLVTFLPTLRCNARCQGCDIWRFDKVGEEMTLEEIKALFEQLYYLKVVKITGGEPFLRRDLPAILDYFLNERKFIVQVTSNGFLTDQIVRAVSDLATPRLHMCISLDGVEEFVDEMRGIHGYYEKVLNTLKKLVEVQKEKRFSLAVNQTLFYHGTSQIAALRPVLAEIGIENIHYTIEHNLFDPKVGEDDKKNYWREVPRDAFLELKQKINTISIGHNLRNVIYKYYFKGLENRIMRGLKKPDLKCTALTSYFRLYPGGEVLTCSVITKPVANLRNADFRQVWSSRSIERAREVVKRCEGCWFGCEVVPNAVVRGDILKGFFYA